MAKTKTKDYILIGKHRAASGKTLKIGDTIKLTEAQAENLANKIRDPKQVVVTNADADEKLVAEISILTEKLQVCEAANAELTEKFGGDIELTEQFEGDVEPTDGEEL